MPKNEFSAAAKMPPGTRFGRLTVIAYAGSIKGHGQHRCVCDCGKEKIVRTSQLKTGNTKSCGKAGCRFGGLWKGGIKNQGSEAWCKQLLRVTEGCSRRRGYAKPFENWRRIKELWEECGGKCACCRKKSDKTLHLDHCHKTGKLRGFLCRWCNHAIGNAGDNPEMLMRMAKYAARHQQHVILFADESVA